MWVLINIIQASTCFFYTDPMGCVSSKSKVTPVGTPKRAKVKRTKAHVASQPVHVKEAWGVTAMDTKLGTAKASIVAASITTPVSLFTKPRERSSQDFKLAFTLKDSGVWEEESAEEKIIKENSSSGKQEMDKVANSVCVCVCVCACIILNHAHTK